MRKKRTLADIPTEAMAWIRECKSERTYVIDNHYIKRCRERGFSMNTWKYIVETATSCTPYDYKKNRDPEARFWKITGRGSDGEEASIGIKASFNNTGPQILIIALF